MNQKDKPDVKRSVTNAVTEVFSRHAVKATLSSIDLKERLVHLKGQFQNHSVEQLAGRVAEEMHAGTFNMDAARKGVEGVKAVTGAAIGKATDAADVFIQQGGEVVARAQLKYLGKVTRSLSEVARKKYDGMQRIIPADQVERARELATRRGADALGSRNYQETAKSVSGVLKHGKVNSQPVTLEDARKIAKNTNTLNLMVASEAAQALGKSAAVAAAFGGVTGVIQQVGKVKKGKVSAAQAARAVAGEVALNAASGAVSTGATLLTQQAVVRLGLTALGKANAPMAAGMLAADFVKDTYHLARGNITREEYGKRSAENAGRASGAIAGLQAGAAIGSVVPVVGTVVGGVVGSIAGSMAGDVLIKNITRKEVGEKVHRPVVVRPKKRVLDAVKPEVKVVDIEIDVEIEEMEVPEVKRRS